MELPTTNFKTFYGEFTRRIDYNLNVIENIKPKERTIDDTDSVDELKQLAEKYKALSEEYHTKYVNAQNKIEKITAKNARVIETGEGEIEETEETQKGEKPTERYEVTQLILSFFGVLIMPFETLKGLEDADKWQEEEKVETKLREANEQAYKDIQGLINTLIKTGKIYDNNQHHWNHVYGMRVITFIHKLRNSLSHGGNHGLHFYPIGEGGQIKYILFADDDKNSSDKFYAEIETDQLRALMTNLQKIFSSYDEGEPFEKNYKTDISNIQRKMKNAGYVTVIFPNTDTAKARFREEVGGGVKTTCIGNRRRKASFFCTDTDSLRKWASENEACIESFAIEDHLENNC